MTPSKNWSWKLCWYVRRGKRYRNDHDVGVFLAAASQPKRVVGVTRDKSYQQNFKCARFQLHVGYVMFKWKLIF
jgi:hypothetical protein